MNKTIYLALALVVAILTAAGVYVTNASYKTTISIQQLGGGPLPNGEYKLVVKVLVNYGPFGGVQPLSSADIWLYYNDHFLNQSLTNASGIVVFYVKPGNYKVFFTEFHIIKNITVSGNVEVILNYAYLKT
ncbi:MAG: hypothetical protein RXR43_02730 [Sulfolobus sp.]